MTQTDGFNPTKEDFLLYRELQGHPLPSKPCVSIGNPHFWGHMLTEEDTA